jgi:arabinose-5-phosphate isomerase
VPALFLDASHALHGDLGSICPGDAVIFLSRSGNTAEMVRTASVIRGWQAKN